MKWTLLLGVLGGAVAYVYLQQQLGEQIRMRIEAKFTQHYAAHGLKVSLRAAELVRGKGIAAYDLAIYDPQGTSPAAELLHVDELLLSCTTDLQELIQHEPEITQVKLRRLTIRATRQGDATWNAARLLPLPKFSERSPTVVLENGTVEILDPSKTPAGTLRLRDIQLTLWPPDAGTPPGTPAGTSPMQRVRGTLGGELVRRIQFDGWVNPRQQLLDLGGTIEGLEVSPELRAALPGSLATDWPELEMLRAQVGASFRLGYQPTAPVPLQFQVDGHLNHGRLDHPRLPHAVTDIQGDFQVSNEGFLVKNLSAHSGTAALGLSCRGVGFGPNRPLTVRADLKQLELNPALMEVLPQDLRRHWMKHHPAGTIDAHVELAFDGERWTPSALLQSSDVSFMADMEKFPYLLEHGRGWLKLENDRLTLGMAAYAGDQPVQLSADVRGLRATPCGWVKAEGTKLTLDERVFHALRGKSSSVVRSLKPRGTIDLYAFFERREPRDPWSRFLQIKLNQCGICYDEFPYPLSNIGGRLELRDDHWDFQELSGTNGTGLVKCRGEMRTTAPAGYALSLVFSGESIPLEGELRNALATRRPGLLDLWNRLKPQGTVDLSEVRVACSSEQPQPNITCCIQPCEDASIEPSAFPYRLEKVRGTIRYGDRRAKWEQCRAEHGNTTVFSDGFCELLADGGWRLHLNNFLLQHVQADRDMIQAMPEGLKRGILGLHPAGSCNVEGTFDLARGGALDAPLTSDWDVQVFFQQAAIDFGLKLENLSGSTRLSGHHDGQNYFCGGELSVDSLTYRNLQLTNLRGPLWLDAQQVLLGEWVDPALPKAMVPNGVRQSLTADLFHGRVHTGARILLGELPQYEIRTQLEQADLATAAQEMLAGRQRSQGRVWAWADLHGVGRSLSDLSGRGQLTLREANIYELPAMISLLKLLRVQPPDTNAFSQCDLSFSLQGSHVYLKPINFAGDAISLLGSGEIELQANVSGPTVHLTLGARLGRPEERIPLLSDILGGVSEQLLLIRVDGALQDPAVAKVALPGVDQALQQLQQDLQGEKPPQRGGGNVPSGASRLGRRLPGA